MNYTHLFDQLAEDTPVTTRTFASHLSPAQQEAVTSSTIGRTIVIAGPGSGKTTVLIERLGYLLANGAAPEDLLVCTFTRAAAEELQSRLSLKLKKYKLPYCGTMHSLAYRMLGGPVWLTNKGLELITEEQQEGMLQDIMQTSPMGDQFSEKEFLLMLQRAQEGDDSNAYFTTLAATWEAKMEALGFIDFVMLLKQSLAVPTRRKFRFVLVDEAQDLTPLQLKWMRVHCAPKAHTYLVGDDDQAVYAFRGSALAVLADEAKAGAKVFQLQDNWRCRKYIVDAAQELIGHNSNRVAAPQIAAKSEGDITVVRFDTEQDELDTLAKMDTKPVILCRTRLEVEHFLKAGFEAYTMHESKGREWPVVWVSGLEQGVVPHAMGNLEEERRLFYVALTRAKDRLLIATRATVDGRARRPSPFLVEAGLVL